MKRLYELVMKDHLAHERQMLFLVGPRQVGKTTTSLDVSEPRKTVLYLNWDIQKDRELIIEGPDEIAEELELFHYSKTIPIIIFDEIHKYKKWKTFLKGFFDKYEDRVKIIVTGSARLDVYKIGGDSLMGRYFLYRLHPLSVAEILSVKLRKEEFAPVSRNLAKEEWESLYRFGGFPEPFLRRSFPFYNRWKKLRFQQLFREDMRDLTNIQDISSMEILAEILQSSASNVMTYKSLANKVDVTVDTIKRWIKTLRSFYYCFTLKPWTKNIIRTLIKEPKIYLWDWSLVEDEGAKVENFIASHLLKAVHYWNDRGFGDYSLHYLRNKEKMEVDFLIVKNKKPWILVEAKKSDCKLSKALIAFQKQTKAPYAFQVVYDLEYVRGNCFEKEGIFVVPAKTFLSQLI